MPAAFELEGALGIVVVERVTRDVVAGVRFVDYEAGVR